MSNTATGVVEQRRPSQKGERDVTRHHSARHRPPDECIVGSYRFIKTIGRGNFAKVKLAKHLPTGRQVAVKVIDKTQMSASNLQKLFREVRIMKALNHPNIVKLFEVIETERHLYLIMEYASGGEIFDYLLAHGRLKEKDVRIKFRQILSAVHYCHQKNIVHRDLKAENLLLDKDMNIKIADFGFSNEFTHGNKLDTFCGSPPYAAPELFQGKKYEGPEVDVWSLGVILYTMASGSLPFDGQNLKELKERVLKGKFRIPFYLSTDCENLIRKFLIINPSKRVTLEAAMKDSWLNLGFFGEELKPYSEPETTIDHSRIAQMETMGYSSEKVLESLTMHRYDEAFATYQLLGMKGQLESTESFSTAAAPPPSQRCTGRSGTGYSPWHLQSRTPQPGPPPPYMPSSSQPPPPASTPVSGSSSPYQNGIQHRLPQPVRFSSRRTPFSCNDSPPPRPQRAESTAGYDNRAALQSASFRASVHNHRPLPSVPCETDSILPPADGFLRPSTASVLTSDASSPSASPAVPSLPPVAGGTPEPCPPWTTKTTAPLRLIVTNTDNGSNSRGIAVRSAFHRHVPGRQTVHNGPVRDKRTEHDGTPVLPLETQEDMAVIGNRTSRMSFFNKLTSKFSKR